MNSNNPKKIIILISLIVALIQIITIVLISDKGLLLTVEVSAIISLITFIVVYGVSNFLLNNFFLEIIKPIYKTIRKVNTDSKKIEEELDDVSFSENLNEEVDAWAQEKINQIARMRETEKYRKEFLGDVSHELKTPIFTIQGYVSTLIDGGINDPNINMKFLKRTENSIDRMITIVEDLISISELESGQLQISKSRFDIVALITEIIEMQENRSQNKNIRLYYKTTEITELFVDADKKLIYQVLLNLIVNSIVYGKDNGTTSISLLNMDKQIMVDITDDGIGIAENNIPRLFERFYRIDKSRSKEHGGTGLGLSICKHILEAHNQSISVTSQLNFGSSFSFTLSKEL